eukprot:3981529-Pyramimonas_sp.AAC.1
MWRKLRGLRLVRCKLGGVSYVAKSLVQPTWFKREANEAVAHEAVTSGRWAEPRHTHSASEAPTWRPQAGAKPKPPHTRSDKGRP